VRVFLLVVTSGLSLAALVIPYTLRPSTFPLQIGDVAPQDIQAPQSITYTSTVLTEQARKDAERGVAPVYLPADPSIARRQIERLRMSLAFINTVRLDGYANLEQKLADLSSLSDIQIPTTIGEQILSLNDSRWQVVQQEALNVLEQVMRNTIREDRLDESRRSVSTLISFSLPEDQAAIVAQLVTGFVVPNSQYSLEQTEAARTETRALVKPITRSFITGETIVLRGQVINDASWEALEQFDLVKPQSYREDILGASALVTLQAVFIALYLNRRKTYPVDDLRSLLLIALLFIVFLFGARLTIPNRTVLPYLFPLPAFGLTIAVLFQTELAMIFSLVLSILAAYGLGNSLDLTFYFILCSLFGVLAIGRARRIANFFWAGIAVGVAGLAIVVAYRLPDTITDWVGIATLTGAAVFNGLASASLTLLLQYLFAQILGLTTTLQLLEISRPDHPLLQFILRNAPGTYQHSLQVANLAEQAAEAIGADALLTRIGAIYHDAGKANNPFYFIENQIPGKLNRHDDIDPSTSAQTIIQHVPDGLVLAKKYRLPPRIRDFMAEHHGTLLTRYQYTKALEVAEGNEELVDPSRFQYPGPIPQSRETALLMLADGCEARVRAELPKDETELRGLIKRVFDYLQKEGQLDDTRLTLRDLTEAQESFLNTLRGIYHPRIQYPEIRQASQAVNTEPTGQNPVELHSTTASPPEIAAQNPK